MTQGRIKRPIDLFATPWPGSRKVAKLQADQLVDIENTDEFGWTAVYDRGSGFSGWINQDDIEEISK